MWVQDTAVLSRAQVCVTPGHVHLRWGSARALVPRHIPALLLLLWSRVGML